MADNTAIGIVGTTIKPETLSAAATLVQIAVAALVSALVSGLFLLGGFYYKRRMEKHSTAQSAWKNLGVPIVNAADDIVARLFDIIVRKRNVAMDKPLILSGFPVFDPSREISTVWRLARYLAASTNLERRQTEAGEDERLANLTFYTLNKAQIAMKGNLFEAPYKLQSEGQQLIGSKILSVAGVSDGRDVDFYKFLNEVKSDRELQDVINACRNFLNFPIDINNPSPQLLAASYWCIYLIDTVQDLKTTSKWEEFRIFLVSLIRSYNKKYSGRAVFLYKIGDLSTDNYIDTYNLLPTEFKKPRLREKRIEIRAKTGFPRTIGPFGVTTEHGKNTITLRYDDNPGDVYVGIKSMFAS
jgi:hypothetical protein